MSKKPVTKKTKPKSDRSRAFEEAFRKIRQIGAALDCECGVDFLIEPGEPNHFLTLDGETSYYNTRPELYEAMVQALAERSTAS